MPTPAIVDGVLVHHDGSGRITGMDPMSGTLLYERDLHSIASMSAALPVGATSFVTSGVSVNALWRIDARTGAVLWRSRLFPNNVSGIGDCPPASDGMRIFGEYVVPDGTSTVTLTRQRARQHAFALDARTGALLWDAPLQDGPLPINNEAGIPVVDNGVVYFGVATAPWMNALDARTGRVLWRSQVYGPVKSAVVVKDGVVYFGDLAGYLWALNARNGQRIGGESLPTSFNVGSGIIAGQTLLIGSFTGDVYALPLETIRRSRV
jgi:outer membrane protein assembly factor BamB